MGRHNQRGQTRISPSRGKICIHSFLSTMRTEWATLSVLVGTARTCARPWFAGRSGAKLEKTAGGRKFRGILVEFGLYGETVRSKEFVWTFGAPLALGACDIMGRHAIPGNRRGDIWWQVCPTRGDPEGIGWQRWLPWRWLGVALPAGPNRIVRLRQRSRLIPRLPAPLPQPCFHGAAAIPAPSCPATY